MTRREQSCLTSDHAQSATRILGSIKPNPRVADLWVAPHCGYWVTGNLHAPSYKGVSLITLTVLGCKHFEDSWRWLVRRPFCQQFLVRGTVQDALAHKVTDYRAVLHIVQDGLHLGIGAGFGPELKLLEVFIVERLLSASECRVVSGTVLNLVAEWVGRRFCSNAPCRLFGRRHNCSLFGHQRSSLEVAARIEHDFNVCLLLNMAYRHQRFRCELRSVGAKVVSRM